MACVCLKFKPFKMKNLQLSLKSKWFEMTSSGIKTEDYREINPYWCNRILTFQGSEKSRRWWEEEFFDWGTFSDTIENIELFCRFKVFSSNSMTKGYPKSTDSERILKLEHKGIEIRTGNPEWGAEPGKLYFVIKHGSVLLT